MTKTYIGAKIFVPRNEDGIRALEEARYDDDNLLFMRFGLRKGKRLAARFISTSTMLPEHC